MTRRRGVFRGFTAAASLKAIYVAELEAQRAAVFRGFTAAASLKGLMGSPGQADARAGFSAVSPPRPH